MTAPKYVNPSFWSSQLLLFQRLIQTSSVTTHLSATPAHGHFCPLLLAQLSQLRAFAGTSDTYQPLQVCPRSFRSGLGLCPPREPLLFL